MPKSRTPLIVPVEMQWREFDAKLLFSLVAAERGFPVIFGSQSELHLRATALPRGIYVAKDIRVIRARMLNLLAGLGHSIVAWDEEGLVPYPGRYYNVRMSAEALRPVSDLFAWGRVWADLARGFPGYDDTPVHETGNPRIDLLRPEVREYFRPEADALRKRYGEFVLINTNFGLFNHFVPSLTRLGPQAGVQTGKAAADFQPDEFNQGLTAHRYALFNLFREMIPALARAFPDTPFVIRPHPSEHHGPWRQAAADCPNVHVVYEGNIAPWLLAAGAVVHNSCTTGVEAFLAGRPVFSYMPVTDPVFDLALPNSLSHCVDDTDSLRDGIGEALAGRLNGADQAGRREGLADHITSMEGPLASDRILDVIEHLDVADTAPPLPPLGRRLAARAGLGRRGMQKQLASLMPGGRSGASYQRHRYPGVPAAGVDARIDRYRSLLGRFEGIRAEPMGRDLFRISQA